MFGLCDFFASQEKFACIGLSNLLLSVFSFRFFRICISMCRDLCVRSILEQGQGPSPTYVRSKCFQNLDAFVRLIALLVKHSGEATNPTTKINLLNKVRKRPTVLWVGNLELLI